MIEYLILLCVKLFGFERKEKNGKINHFMIKPQNKDYLLIRRFFCFRSFDKEK